ncbi:hypothetical protein CYMTET_8080 [Cymbomonas tetramitiformis]|uniref:Guanine nucleotide-binding protein subunit beta-like protein n=1 Tax=Cymbomonas tetramitiformis TaxID=36881 RepID=A0AAE0GU87_9CHLO|nr:hypothetical protein CYMTET_8080 [Cymbomonas tetramitiformis]
MIQGGAAAGNSREWSLGDEHGRVMCGHDPGYLGGVTAVSSHGGELISGAWDSQLKVWDPLSGAVRRSIHVGNWIYGLSHCDHDPSLAVVACTGGMFPVPGDLLNVWNLTNGVKACSLIGHRRGVHNLRVRGEWGISGSRDSVHVWHLPRALAGVHRPHQIPLTSVVEEPEETNAQIATSCLSLDNLDGDLGCVEISVQGGTDGWMALCPQAEAKAVVYDVPTGKRLYRIPLPNISQASTRGALAMEAAGGRREGPSRSIDVDGRHGMEAGNLGSPRSGGSAELLLFAGAFGVVVSDPRDKPTRPAARIPTPHDGHPTTAMRSAREGAGASVDLATGGANGTVCVWDVRVWKQHSSLPRVTSAASPVTCVDMDAAHVMFGNRAAEVCVWACSRAPTSGEDSSERRADGLDQEKRADDVHVEHGELDPCDAASDAVEPLELARRENSSGAESSQVVGSEHGAEVLQQTVKQIEREMAILQLKSKEQRRKVPSPAIYLV